MTTYYKTIDCTDPSYEAGEIVARCTAKDLQRAKQILGVNERNEDRYCVYHAEKLPANVYDPRLLRK